MPNLELDNILEINGQSYNVNAVHSDAASKVDHKLIIRLPEETLDQDYIMEIGLDITNMEYEDDDIDLDEFIERIEDAVVISCEDALEKINLNIGILDYLVSKGIQIGDMIEVGMSLLENIEESQLVYPE